MSLKQTRWLNRLAANHPDVYVLLGITIYIISSAVLIGAVVLITSLFLPS